MKLYATVTSERASKGQGGNKQLDIDVLVYDRFNPRYHITITQDALIFTERGYSTPLLTRSHRDIREQEEAYEQRKRREGELEAEIRGKKQKGVIHESDVIRNEDGDEVEQ